MAAVQRLLACIGPTRPWPGGRAVLVVDDEPIVRTTLALALQHLG